MVVVDSSALVPLAWAGQLDSIDDVFDEIRTTRAVQDEVLVEGRRGTAALESFLKEATIGGTPSEAERVANLEGIAVADASVVLLAEDREDVLLANDKGLMTVARSHGVECWWVTTLVLKCTKDGVFTAEEGEEVLYDLVNEGMNLHPKVYAQVQRQLRELGE